MRRILLVLPVALGLGACADTNPTVRNVGTGAGIGALGGAAIGSFSGNAGMGALIGAGAGAAGGFLFDRHQQSNERAFQQGVQQGRSQPR